MSKTISTFMVIFGILSIFYLIPRRHPQSQTETKMTAPTENHHAALLAAPIAAEMSTLPQAYIGLSLTGVTVWLH